MDIKFIDFKMWVNSWW